MILLEPQNLLVRWLCKRIDLLQSPYMTALGSADANGAILGVVGYDNYTGASCKMHMAGSNGFFTRAFLRAIFTYPFKQLECNVVIAEISSANSRSLSVAKRIGFKQIYRIPDALVDGDAIVLTLRREDCIWLEKEHELRQETAEAA